MVESLIQRSLEIINDDKENQKRNTYKFKKKERIQKERKKKRNKRNKGRQKE